MKPKKTYVKPCIKCGLVSRASNTTAMNCTHFA